MSKLVVCNKADRRKIFCTGCVHANPHEFNSKADRCWGTCWDNKEQEAKARVCVDIPSKRGKKK